MTGRREVANRRARIEHAIREGLAAVVRELKDPRILAAGLASVNMVELNRDASVAVIYLSFLAAPPAGSSATGNGSEARPVGRPGELINEALAGLQAAAGYLRTTLGARVRIGRMPQLRFRYDPTAEVGEHLARIVANDDAARVADPAGASSDESPEGK